MLLYNSGPAPSMVPPEGSVPPIAGAHVMGGAIGVPEPAGPAHLEEGQATVGATWRTGGVVTLCILVYSAHQEEGQGYPENGGRRYTLRKTQV